MENYDNLNPNQYEFALHNSAIYISPIEYGLLYDQCFKFPYENELSDGELMESVWQMSSKLSYKETIKRMTDLGFVHNVEFQNYLIEENGYQVEQLYGLIDPEDVYFCFYNDLVYFQLIKEYESDGYNDSEIPFRNHIQEELNLEIHMEDCYKYEQDQEELKNKLISFGYVYNEEISEYLKNHD